MEVFWRQIDDNGGRGGLTVRWVKAHTRAGEGGAAAPTETDRVINAHANRLEGLGSEAAAAQSLCEPAAAAYRR